jgi:hypothetical protein
LNSLVGDFCTARAAIGQKSQSVFEKMLLHFRSFCDLCPSPSIVTALAANGWAYLFSIIARWEIIIVYGLNGFGSLRSTTFEISYDNDTFSLINELLFNLIQTQGKEGCS